MKQKSNSKIWALPLKIPCELHYQKILLHSKKEQDSETDDLDDFT